MLWRFNFEYLYIDNLPKKSQGKWGEKKKLYRLLESVRHGWPWDFLLER